MKIPIRAMKFRKVKKRQNIRIFLKISLKMKLGWISKETKIITCWSRRRNNRNDSKLMKGRRMLSTPPDL